MIPQIHVFKNRLARPKTSQAKLNIKIKELCYIVFIKKKKTTTTDNFFKFVIFVFFNI